MLVLFFKSNDLPAVEGSLDLNTLPFENNLYDAYFYHSDHLGSSNYISNNTGIVSQHTEYLPFGETFVDEHLNSHNTPFKFNAKEFDDETGNYYYGARYYNPKWSTWLSVDPLVEKTMDAYGYCYQNPINLIDPIGLEADGWIKDLVTGEITYDENVTGPENTPTGSTFVCQECNLNELPFNEQINSNEYFKGDNLNADGSRTQTIELNEVVLFSGDKNKLDPSTVGQNIWGLTYPGGNNPLNFNLEYDYSYVPSDLAEYPAIGHDRRYDNLKIEGASGLFLDTRAIGADWRFVKEELAISILSLNPKTKFNAGALGVGLGLAALPKTLVALSQPQGLSNAIMWYEISNVGVNNKPDKK